MSLLKFLTAGRSLVGMKEPNSRYEFRAGIAEPNDQPRLMRVKPRQRISRRPLKQPPQECPHQIALFCQKAQPGFRVSRHVQVGVPMMTFADV